MAATASSKVPSNEATQKKNKEEKLGMLEYRSFALYQNWKPFNIRNYGTCKSPDWLM